jgi:hypothetical protein
MNDGHRVFDRLFASPTTAAKVAAVIRFSKSETLWQL